MQEKISAFTSRYEYIRPVLQNEVLIFPPFDPNVESSPRKHQNFNAIWDTGATGTVITKNVVDALDLDLKE